MRRGCCFLTHQSSGHASQQTVRTSTRQLRLERHGLGGEPSEPHWGSGPLGGPKLRPYIASASRNHKPRRSARRSLIGLPFLAAGLLKTLGKHRQSLQTPSRHRRNPDRDGVHWHRLLDRIHGRAWGRFSPASPEGERRLGFARPHSGQARCVRRAHRSWLRPRVPRLLTMVAAARQHPDG
jgi:hypothetical protein